MSFQTTVRLADARAATWYIWRRNKLKSAVFIWIVASILGGWIGSQISGAPPLWFELSIVLVAVGIGLAWFYWFLISRASRRLANRAEKLGPENWTIRDDGIQIENSEGTLQLKWRALRGYAETKRLILPRLATSCLVIPIQCLTARERQTLLGFFRSKNLPRRN
jgi:hypothetical protein